MQEISSKAETLAFADLVLPAATWTEKEGTMTNSERRISYLNKIVDAPGAALPDAEIICRFAKKMGFAGFDFSSPAEIFAEHCALTAGTNMDISGLSYNLLKELRSVQWPFPKEAGHNGTPRLFTNHEFYTPSKKSHHTYCEGQQWFRIA